MANLFRPDDVRIDDAICATEQLASEIGEACDEFEAAEFPGMYS